ncbi:unnamed protein product, partial [marine sediment metagenome]
MKILKKLLPIVIILAVLITTFMPAQPVLADSTLFESYTTGDDYNSTIYEDLWRAQTFTPSTAHTVTSVKLLIYGKDNPGDFTVSIKATDGSGHPTGEDLCYGTINGNDLPDTKTWTEITLGAGTSLSAETKYA